MLVVLLLLLLLLLLFCCFVFMFQVLSEVRWRGVGNNQGLEHGEIVNL